MTAIHSKHRTNPRPLLLEPSRLTAKGAYIHAVNGADWQQDPNLVPDEGLAYMLDVAFGTREKITNWYLALYSGQVTPVSGWTAATFASTATEIVSSSEGYTAGTRLVYSTAAPSENQISNYAAKAVFTFASASSVTVEGVALLSSPVKGDTSGILVSASRFAQPRVMYANDTLTIGYAIALAS